MYEWFIAHFISIYQPTDNGKELINSYEKLPFYDKKDYLSIVFK